MDCSLLVADERAEDESAGTGPMYPFFLFFCPFRANACAKNVHKEREDNLRASAHFGSWWRLKCQKLQKLTYGGKDKGSAQQWHGQDIPTVYQAHKDQQEML